MYVLYMPNALVASGATPNASLTSRKVSRRVPGLQRAQGDALLEPPRATALLAGKALIAEARTNIICSCWPPESQFSYSGAIPRSQRKREGSDETAISAAFLERVRGTANVPDNRSMNHTPARAGRRLRTVAYRRD